MGELTKTLALGFHAGGPWKPRYDQPTLGPVVSHGFGARGLSCSAALLRSASEGFALHRVLPS